MPNMNTQKARKFKWFFKMQALLGYGLLLFMGVILCTVVEQETS
jgi:hypothetical protein